MKKLIGVLTLLLFNILTFAQNSETVEIYFEQGSSTIDKSYSVNANMLSSLAQKLSIFTTDSTITITKIKIDSYTSPEGGLELNDSLSFKRAQVIYNYIKSLDLNISDSIIELKSNGIAWDDLRAAVYESDMPYREEILKIIDEVPEETWAKVPTSRWLKLVDSRNKQLMDLKYGNPYLYMMDHIFPSLRKSKVVTIYFKEEIKPEPKPEVIPEPEPEPEPVVEPEPEVIYQTKPLFALKSNLLFDLLSLINVELEVPLGNRWSIAGEWNFPWWTLDNGAEDSRRSRIQLLNGNLEAKYWFGDRDIRPVMTGWFMGAYGGMGKADFEYNKTGYQSESFYSAGLTAGYAHTINKKGNLRMEYSLGLGYLEADYNKYNAQYQSSEWKPIIQEGGTYSWVGPTRAKVSLVWLLNKTVKKGGVK